MLNLINGSQTIGNGRGFWIAFLAVLAIALVYPMFADSYDVGNFSYFLIWIFMALGLSLIWGYGRMLSFGQTFFFSIAGFPYGVLAAIKDVRGTVIGVVLIFFGYVRPAVLKLPSGAWWALAAVLGWVNARVLLSLAFFLGQTAGPEWHIGAARLNGFNGMKGMDPLTVGNIYIEGDLYYLMIIILIVYLGLRMSGEFFHQPCNSPCAKTRSVLKCSATMFGNTSC